MINLLCLAVCAAIVLGMKLASVIIHPAGIGDRVGDFEIMYDYSQIVARDHVYPPFFPYAPPAVAFFLSTTVLPFELAAGLWVFLSWGATLGVLAITLSLIGLGNHPLRWGAALAVAILEGYFIKWDLHSANCNIIYLFLVTSGLFAMKHRHAGWAGFLLGASAALKLYSVAVIGYLLAKRQWKAATSVAVWSAIIWTAVPLVAFGIDGTRAVYLSWMDQIQSLTLGRDSYDFLILVSLKKALSAWLDESSLDGAVMMARGIWFGLLAVVLALAWKDRREERDGIGLAIGGGLMTLALVPVSPYLEPFHMIPCLAVTLGLIAVAMSPREQRWLRVFAGCAVAGCWLVLKFGPKDTQRGLSLYVYAVCLAAGGIAYFAKGAFAQVDARQFEQTESDELNLSAAPNRIAA